MSGYDFHAIEGRWQQHWETRGTFRTPNPGDPAFDPRRPKYYVLDMFPYPSGAGLHVGHPLGYIATDVVARYKRMRGFNVLHPMGFDAFGLPAEQFAVEHGVHPRVTTEQNIATMIRQLKRLGLSYDWDRCLATTDVGYYKWTQWIFLQLYTSYFDPRERKARPIRRLVHRLESGELAVGPGDRLVPGEASSDPTREQLKFNTAIAALIDLNNEMVGWAAGPFVLMLAPLAPHLAEELWRALGHDSSLAYEAWPRWEEGLATDAQIQMAVQVMGKVRSRITVPADADEQAAEAAALADIKVRASIAGKAIRRVIVVPGKVVNIVTD